MNYLELTRRLAQEVGASGHVQTAVGAEGEHRRLADWINEAWNELQLIRDTWRWRLAEFEDLLPAGTKVVDLSTTHPNFYKVIQDRVYVRPAGANSSWAALNFIKYSQWVDTIRTRPDVEGFPAFYTELPDRRLELNPVPSADVSIKGLYVRKPQVLVTDADEPYLPAEYHMIIVYKAMMLYAQYEAAPEIFQAGAQGFNRIYQSLVNSEIPEVGIASEFI